MYEYVQKSYKSGVKDARLHNGGLWIEDSDSSRGQTYSIYFYKSMYLSIYFSFYLYIYLQYRGVCTNR